MAINFKPNISNYLKRTNVKRFIIFFVISFVFLLISKFSNDYKQIIILKPNLENLDNEIILKDTINKSIEVRVEAKGFSLVPFIFDNKKTLKIDTQKNVQVSDSVFVFDISENMQLIDELLGSSYKILSVQPQSLTIPYEKLASKSLSIAFNKNVKFASGFDVRGNFELNIDSVKAVGALSDLKKIDSIETDTLILTNVNGNVNEMLGLDLSAYKDINIFPKKVKVTANVSRFTEGKVEVPISIINKPPGITINYFPKTVTVTYYVTLEDYKTIDPTNFIVECDFAKVKENQTFLIPEITKQSKSVKRVNIKQKRIDFIKL